MASININLLPEIRLLKIRARQRKRLATTLMILVGVVTLTVIGALIILIGYNTANYNVNQGKISRLKTEVASYGAMEQAAATIQEHLASFDQLNKNRLIASAIFSHLTKVIPPDAALTNLTVTTDYKASITGTAANYKSVGILAKALEQYNVDFKVQSDLEHKQIFTQVNIGNVSKDQSGTSFNISFIVDKSIIEKSKGGV